MNNPNLPKANAPKEWSAELLLELKRCREDPVYFAEKYFKIVHVDHGLIPLKLYDFQRNAISLATDNRRLVINASRQVGKTTIATAIILHFALFNKDKTVALLANKADTAREILSRIQMAYEYLPDWLKGGVKEWNKGSVIFENNSKIIAAASSSSAIRGKSVAMLYIDEMSFIEHWEEFSASVLPTLSSGKETKTIFTSTPNGLNHFFYYVEGAKLGTNGFKYLEVPWYDVPGRDEAWKQEVLETINHDQEKFEAEYCCSFQGSSGTLISGATLKTLFPTQYLRKKDGLTQYADPAPGRTYALIVDVSRGKGLDYSAFHVIDVTDSTYHQVCTYRNNMVTPTDYTAVVHNIATAYNQAMVLVEVNDIGGQVSDQLHNDYEYENIISTESAGRAGKRVSGGSGPSVDMGIRTSKQVKAIGCSVLKLLIEQGRLKIYDKETIAELNTFSRKGTSYEAEPGNHDDLVMGLVLFAWLTQDLYFKDLTDFDMMKHLRDRTDEEIREELVPFGFRVDGLEDAFEEQIQPSGWWQTTSW